MMGLFIIRAQVEELETQWNRIQAILYGYVLCLSFHYYACSATFMLYQDTYRAEWAFQILFAPERVPGMVRSMLADYVQVSPAIGKRLSTFQPRCREAGYRCGKISLVRLFHG
jgi:hypothetical protein